MSVRVVDNKRLEMTEDEWTQYGAICRSYDRQNFKGEELFRDLFETDDFGIIVYLKPPSIRYTSMEVFMFLMALMQHQHLRLMHKQVDDACAEIKELAKNK